MKQDGNNPNKLPLDINKQMLEIKKKIQLSEGRRKAAFEECEAEKKRNEEEIHNLKKTITDLIVELNEAKKATSALKKINQKLEGIGIGLVFEKNPEDIERTLDLHIIDKAKALDLMQYKIAKRQLCLENLGKEYQKLLSQKELKEVSETIEKPAKKALCDLQNSIHAVEVQFREANHISVRYKEIKKNLQKDAARFESNIKKIEEELNVQSIDINRLQQVMNEASKMRGVARGHLLKEEKRALSSANARERQIIEGKRLVFSRKQELEYLEKRIFQAGKIPNIRTENVDELGEDEVESPPEPFDALGHAFDVLKQTTGATSTQEVLQKFQSQKDTHLRLNELREKYESEKLKLEQDFESLNNKLEHFKYMEGKESAKKSVEMENIQNQIQEQRQKSEKNKTARKNKEKTIKTILTSLQELHLSLNPIVIPSDDLTTILNQIKIALEQLLLQVGDIDLDRNVLLPAGAQEGLEDQWLPPPYSGLVRRTPLPTGASPAPPQAMTGSEDETEVPSRGYLKRQAQLVVDAKSRRKNIRMQIRRN